MVPWSNTAQIYNYHYISLYHCEHFEIWEGRAMAGIEIYTRYTHKLLLLSYTQTHTLPKMTTADHCFYIKPIINVVKLQLPFFFTLYVHMGH